MGNDAPRCACEHGRTDVRDDGGGTPLPFSADSLRATWPRTCTCTELVTARRASISHLAPRTSHCPGLPAGSATLISGKISTAEYQRKVNNDLQTERVTVVPQSTANGLPARSSPCCCRRPGRRIHSPPVLCGRAVAIAPPEPGLAGRRRCINLAKCACGAGGNGVLMRLRPPSTYLSSRK